MNKLKVGKHTVIITDRRPDKSHCEINLPDITGEQIQYAANAKSPHRILGLIPDRRIPIYIRGQRGMFGSEIMRMIDGDNLRGLRAAQSFLSEPADTLLLDHRVIREIASRVNASDTVTVQVKVDKVEQGYIRGSVSLSVKNGETFTFPSA